MNNSNIIELSKETITHELESRLVDLERDISDLVKGLKVSRDEQYAAESVYTNASRKDKQQYKQDLDNKKITVKRIKDELDLRQQEEEQIRRDLVQYKSQVSTQEFKAAAKTSAEHTFTENNIHYVIFCKDHWWSVDPAGDRMSVKINSCDGSAVRDLIYLESDLEIRDEQELKRLAKTQGRMFKHIVRDFNTQKRPGIYNQMIDIRKHWLKPVEGVEPHEAFRLLTLSIAGGSPEYADQLERIVAYRYCHPEDVMIPNIDSCALGGTGRDTFFNLIATIFTNECCGSASEETFKGTHNGDLFGKMFVKVDEKNSNVVPIDKIKELTGSTRYRNRMMNANAVDAVRLFNFVFFRNGYTTTAKLAGTGSSGEDRRFEPIIARINLTRHIALHYGIISSLEQQLSDEQSKAMTVITKDWQRDYYKNEERIAEWLGYIIAKHNAPAMTELLPLHGVYYEEMVERQRKGIDGFMPKFMSLMANSTVICLKDAHKLFSVAESHAGTKDWFKNQLLYWLNSKCGWDAEVVQEHVYPYSGATAAERRIITHIYNKLDVPEKRVFDVEDFIDVDALDDKGTTIGRKITPQSLRDELR